MKSNEMCRTPRPGTTSSTDTVIVLMKHRIGADRRSVWREGWENCLHGGLTARDAVRAQTTISAEGTSAGYAVPVSTLIRALAAIGAPRHAC